MRAKIVNGVWTRNVPWHQKGGWRTDIFKSVLAQSDLRECHFILKDGPTVIVSTEELRRILLSGRDHYGGEIWGPFNIDPTRRTIDGQEVAMEVVLS